MAHNVLHLLFMQSPSSDVRYRNIFIGVDEACYHETIRQQNGKFQ